mmetsp:Transcript_56283/g.138115  ORF Transcript_56283/g.138115 Transcript_56283/m.138115 type:complete len:314 (+) Transcript_56283:2643-3584(+)
MRPFDLSSTISSICISIWSPPVISRTRALCPSSSWATLPLYRDNDVYSRGMHTTLRDCTPGSILRQMFSNGSSSSACVSSRAMSSSSESYSVAVRASYSFLSISLNSSGLSGNFSRALHRGFDVSSHCSCTFAAVRRLPFSSIEDNNIILHVVGFCSIRFQKSASLRTSIQDPICRLALEDKATSMSACCTASRVAALRKGFVSMVPGVSMIMSPFLSRRLGWKTTTSSTMMPMLGVRNFCNSSRTNTRSCAWWMPLPAMITFFPAFCLISSQILILVKLGSFAASIVVSFSTLSLSSPASTRSFAHMSTSRS